MTWEKGHRRPRSFGVLGLPLLLLSTIQEIGGDKEHRLPRALELFGFPIHLLPNKQASADLSVLTWPLTSLWCHRVNCQPTLVWHHGDLSIRSHKATCQLWKWDCWEARRLFKSVETGGRGVDCLFTHFYLGLVFEQWKWTKSNPHPCSLFPTALLCLTLTRKNRKMDGWGHCQTADQSHNMAGG